MNTPLQIVTFAVPLSGNKGSASMLLGLRDAFARAEVNAHFHVFSYYPARDEPVASTMPNVTVHAGHPKDIAFKILPMMLIERILPFLISRKWKQSLRVLRECDVVLAVGGTTFADSMLFKVPWNVLAALPGYWRKRRTIFVSQTVGPLEKRLNRWSARWTFKRAAHVHGRGRRSESWIRGLGIRHSSYWPDLSFSMNVPDFDDIASTHDILAKLRDALRTADRPAVGVTPNSIVFEKARKAGKDYVEFLTGVIASLHARGFLPVLIPHSYLDDISRMHNNDRALCNAVMSKLPKETQCFYVDADLPSPELRSLVGRLHLLVASRFHSMVSALAMGVPPITYGWGHHKYIEVLDEFGVSDLYIPYDELSIESFGQMIDSVHARRRELSQRIAERLAAVTEQSDQLPQEILKRIATT